MIELSELQIELDNSLEDVTFFDIAKVTHTVYKNSYVVTNIKNQVWFHFKDHKWIKTELGPYKEISTKILDIYRTYINKMRKDRKKYSKRIENCEKVLFYLKDVKSKEIIYKECIYLFYNELFMTYLDIKLDLIPFQNGVYDLKSKIFRDGVYDDYLSIYINAKYDNENSDSHKIKDFIIFRNELCSKRFRNFNKMFILKNDW